MKKFAEFVDPNGFVSLVDPTDVSAISEAQTPQGDKITVVALKGGANVIVNISAHDTYKVLAEATRLH